ncbi:BRCA1/BRCA2-containing complex [Capsaspora owczarzaki ATCC 30864]|uniref:BRCA1/BRCA2-containing complex n=1 Tax=Capsaspora owczarzaki (strain ATCC 30864) TaxID=595528 RepID=A0A0D2WVE6_CAPO3|nr:BRCA1/BRCA2-containing complex [Capsaspora owczarzaki ATCC 30864]KJE96123.1 BRCA1/BRCA2-containing complex [Capsaspora owczarzaki ATCC 30864]|eukprot:XP_004345240.2 BRCA1/BRCA2-containing complex [Capsaspora owczarzaki ATCC 30864]
MIPTLARCVLSADAFRTCFTHALASEHEEIMGLLIGELTVSEAGEDESHIHSVCLFKRSDRQKDRVEISPEELAAATTEAERLSGIADRDLRVLGWYHSHPHITVWPSHVDVNTQAAYQQMDKNFVGLIFSCFHTEPNKANRLQVICFQAVPEPSYLSSTGSGKFVSREVPLQVVSPNGLTASFSDSLSLLASVMVEEERDLYSPANQSPETVEEIMNAIHNGSVFTKSMTGIAENLCIPLIRVLEAQLGRNHQRMLELNRLLDSPESGGQLLDMSDVIQ